MYYQEDIEVRGDVSPLLAYNIPFVIKLYHKIRPKLFKPIDVKYSSVKTLESNVGDHWGVGTAFSGGVDSTYTLWSHLSDNQSIVSAQITHGLFVHGIDILLNQTAYYDHMQRIYSNLFQQYNLELIPARTNVYSFYEFRVDWMIGYGPPLIGTALQLDRLFNRFYIPSGLSIPESVLRKSTFAVIAFSHQLLSTEKSRIVLHSPVASRTEKIDAIRNWPEIWGSLRVCAALVKPEDHINCCSCGKCLYLMTYLDIVGDLNNFTSFHKPFRSVEFFSWLWKKYEPFVRAITILRLARKFKRWDILLVMLLIFVPLYIKNLGYNLYNDLRERMPANIMYSIKSKVFPKNI